MVYDIVQKMEVKMKTKRLVDFLNGVPTWYESDGKVINKIIKRLEEYDGLDEELIREIAKKIVEEVFGREYTTDNSQTQRIIKEMLEEAGVKVKK